MLPKKITIIVFLGLTIFSFAQCKTVKNNTTQDKTSLLFIKPMVNDTTISRFNKDKSMQLYLKKIIKPGDPANHFEYKVYKTQTKEIIKQGTFRGVSVDWYDNTSLKLISYVGIEQKPNSENPNDALLSNPLPQITIIKLHK